MTRLKRQMSRCRLTQHHVAAVAGVDRTMVNKVVNGRAKSERVLSLIRQLIALAQHTGR
jgi:predicted XRE-type DNA-binding protein